MYVHVHVLDRNLKDVRHEECSSDISYMKLPQVNRIYYNSRQQGYVYTYAIIIMSTCTCRYIHVHV